MAKAEDSDNYFKIPPDNRSLNYASYFTDGDIQTSKNDDYHSHNAKRLDFDETVSILNKLDFVKDLIN